jgi:hypothetical protein
MEGFCAEVSLPFNYREFVKAPMKCISILIAAGQPDPRWVVRGIAVGGT